jgi:hypothetical protein
MASKWFLGVFVLLIVIGLVWASDQITLQGERTIYTVTCERGTWSGDRCTGTLAAGERHAFRASRTRQEVIHWIRGSQEPIEKYTDCRVANRDNWACRARADQKLLFTSELINGRPTPTAADSTTAARLHAVTKVKWYALKIGLRVFADADY